MKKSIIAAGASAVALAAMPVATSFATVNQLTQNIDTLIVNVSSTCTITRGNTSAANIHANGTSNIGSWGEGTGDPAPEQGAVGHADTLAGTITVGTVYSNFGSSNFAVKCNNAGGWTVTAEATALDNDTNNADGYQITLGTPSATTSSWNYTSSSNEGSGEGAYVIGDTGTYSAASQVVASGTKTTGNTGVSFKVQYAVSAAYDIPEDTYTGSIAYTLAEL